MPGSETNLDAAVGPTGNHGARGYDTVNRGATGNGAVQLGSPSVLRREILLVIRQVGPSSPDQLAGHLRVSRTGILQQLRALESAGLVSHRTERHGVGRPRHVYDVTADAQGLFPSNYDGLAAGLLEAIVALGGDSLVDRVFEERGAKVRDRVATRLAERLPPDAPLAERVRELAAIQDEQGYLCSVQLTEDGTIRLVEHNCAIFQVATVTGSACRAELEMFGDVLGADVVRETHIASGARACTYRVEPASTQPR